MKENEIEFGRSLHQLQQEPVFHLPSFEKEIDRIKSRIAEVNMSIFVFLPLFIFPNFHSQFFGDSHLNLQL
jgi:hypothetical protein